MATNQNPVAMIVIVSKTGASILEMKLDEFNAFYNGIVNAQAQFENTLKLSDEQWKKNIPPGITRDILSNQLIIFNEFMKECEKYLPKNG